MAQLIDFDLNVSGVPYLVRASQQLFNLDIQYRVIINGEQESLFVFDPQLGRYAPVGDDAFNVPDDVEIAIGNKLNSISAPKH